MTYAPEHERAAAGLLDDEDGDERGEEVLGAVAGREELGILVLLEANLPVELGRLFGTDISQYSRIAPSMNRGALT